MIVSEKTSIYFVVELSLREISHAMYVHRSFAQANDAKIVRRRGCPMQY